MKNVYIVAGICILLLGTHLVAYNKGYKAGSNEVKSELYETTQKEAVGIVQASKKALDFQRVIVNNNSDCFKWVWDDEIINATNPQLRGSDNVRK